MTDEPRKPLEGWKSAGLWDEEYVFAHVLAILCEHCGTGGDELDSDGIAITADLMGLCAEDGYIEITGAFGGHIFATVTPEGRTLLEQLRDEEECEQARKDSLTAAMIEPRAAGAGNESDE